MSESGEVNNEDPLKSVSDSISKLTGLFEKLMNSQEEQRKRQDERIDQLIEQSGGQRLTPSQSKVKPSVDALESRIQSFCYDPEEYTFEEWYVQYKEIFESLKSDMDDKSLVLMLMRHLDVKSGTQYRDHISPAAVTDKDFDTVVKDLTMLFGRQVSLFEWRLRYLNLKMSTENMDVRRFACEVNRVYQKGGIKEMTDDQRQVTTFLAGLDVPELKNVRVNLLSVVNAKPDIKLNELVEKYSAIVALERDARAVGDVTKINAVKYTDRPRGGRVESEKSQAHGREKWKKKCPYCERSGHGEDDCWDKYPERRPKKAKKSSHSLKCSDGISSMMVKIVVNGEVIPFQIDTGSDVSMVSLNTWNMIGKPRLVKDETEIECTNGSLLKIHGVFQCEIKYHEVTVQSSMRVTACETNLIGLDLFWKLHMHSVLAKSKIVKECQTTVSGEISDGQVCCEDPICEVQCVKQDSDSKVESVCEEQCVKQYSKCVDETACEEQCVKQCRYIKLSSFCGGVHTKNDVVVDGCDQTMSNLALKLDADGHACRELNGKSGSETGWSSDISKSMCVHEHGSSVPVRKLPIDRSSVNNVKYVECSECSDCAHSLRQSTVVVASEVCTPGSQHHVCDVSAGALEKKDPEESVDDRSVGDALRTAPKLMHKFTREEVIVAAESQKKESENFEGKGEMCVVQFSTVMDQTESRVVNGCSCPQKEDVPVAAPCSQTSPNSRRATARGDTGRRIKKNGTKLEGGVKHQVQESYKSP